MPCTSQEKQALYFCSCLYFEKENKQNSRRETPYTGAQARLAFAHLRSLRETARLHRTLHPPAVTKGQTAASACKLQDRTFSSLKQLALLETAGSKKEMQKAAWIRKPLLLKSYVFQIILTRYFYCFFWCFPAKLCFKQMFCIVYHLQ